MTGGKSLVGYKVSISLIPSYIEECLIVDWEELRYYLEEDKEFLFGLACNETATENAVPER